MTLVSAAELGALRGVAESGMITPAQVYRRSTVSTDNGMTSVWTLSSTITGWLYSEPRPILTIDAGEVNMDNTYRWFCPVGSDVQSGDKMIIGGSEFTVSDTNAESTWLPLLRCSLRRAK